MVSTIRSRKGSNTRTSPVFGLVLFLLCLFLPLSSALAEEWRYSGVERIVAFGDVHGAYDALIETLQRAEVIDEDLSWSGGKTHLVSTGDLLDRGADSRRVMDLMMRLEKEARRAGGRVHQLLGNHEVMNLIGDLRYVADEEYAAFLDMESKKERDFWYRRFRPSQPVHGEMSIKQKEFEEKAPPGFFGHREAFRSDGVYGKWLLDKPIMVVVNDTVFVHGGLPPFVAMHGLEGANKLLKSDLSVYVSKRETLQRLRVIGPMDPFKAIPPFLTRKSKSGHLVGSVLVTAQTLINRSDSPLHDAVGPTWYRGTAACNSLVEGDRLNAVLDVLDAKRVVIGHTTTVTRQVQQRMNTRVVEIDTGMLAENYGGSGNALIIEGDRVSVINQGGAPASAPIDHPIRVGHDSVTLTDNDLAAILKSGEIVSADVEGAAPDLVHVSAGDITVAARFGKLPSQEGFVPELAAFKLDRLLGLGMVPVTVRREVNGNQGTLQLAPEKALTEHERVAAGKGKRASCDLDRQRDAMTVFDTLIRNLERTPSSMLYDAYFQNLVLVDHENSFDVGVDWPIYFKEVDLVIGDQWRSALLQLDDQRLHEELAGLLDDQRLAALLDRRDSLMRLAIGM